MINADIIWKHIFKQKFNINNYRFMMMFLSYMIYTDTTSHVFFDFLLEHKENDQEDSENSEEI